MHVMIHPRVSFSSPIFRRDLVRFARNGDGTERGVFLSMHWNNIEFNAKNGAKPGGGSGVVGIEMGVGEGGVFV